MKTNCKNHCDPAQSPYCTSGLGRGTEFCTCKTKVEVKRVLSGPGISEEITKLGCLPSSGESPLLLPDSVNSKESLSRYLESIGHKRGSEEYFRYYKLYSEKFQFESHNPLYK